LFWKDFPPMLPGMLHRNPLPGARRLAAFPLLVFLSLLPLVAGPGVTRLRCEHRENPAGIDAPTPRLSWQMTHAQPGAAQTAYQIRVASRADRLKNGQADLWDSGKVVSDQSVLVPYGGPPLASHAECHWQVRVWDQRGKASQWSTPAFWSMGILDPNEWRARWIGRDEPEQTNTFTDTSWIWFPLGNPAVDAPVETNWFRRVLTLPAGRPIKRAIFQYTGDNLCRGWLDVSDLGARNNFRVVKWNDITSLLEPGRTHVFGLEGVNRGDVASGQPNPAAVIGRLDIEFADGGQWVIRTDAQWKAARVFAPGWNTVAFDDAHWQPAMVLGPAGIEPWGQPRIPEERRFPARWLRKEFALDKKVRRATLHAAGLGSSELHLNGRKVGDHVLSPPLAQYDQRVYYVSHDVTRQLRPGANALGAVLAGGRFASDRSQVFNGTINFGWPKLLLHLRVEHTDGSVSEIVSDGSWQLTTDGPIRAAGEFDGEEYDARLKLGRWSEPGYNASQWQPVQLVAAPTGRLSALRQEPIRVIQDLKPVAITEPEPGRFIFDLGQNLVGWCRLKVSGPAGTRVTLRHAETLRDDGTLYLANLRGAQAADSYTLKGGGTEFYEPRFTYHGFRYVEVTGHPGRPARDAITGRVVHDDLPVAGEFVCSNELLNQIYRNIVWGTRGNYRSIPTDCPQRDERQGWLGDRSEFVRSETYLFHVAPFYAKWLQDISDAQRPNGSVPDVAPAYWPIYRDNVTWPSTLVIAPGVMHRQYADPGPITDRYASQVRWLELMRGYLTNGIIAKDNYGDWCVPPEDLRLIHAKDPARRTDPALLATAYFHYNHRLMAQYATRLGRADDAVRFTAQAEELKTAFNARFLDRDKGYYDNGTQTACVLPLAFGLVPDEFRDRVFARLVDKIENESRGHIGTGLVGAQHLMRVLSDHGRADLAYRLATNDTYPSWGYMVRQGATTIWELWNGNTADPSMNSGNHVMLIGDLGIWLYEYLAGIAADPAQPGFKHIIMRPHPVGDLTFVRASHESPYGSIRSHWRRSRGEFNWEVEIPPNTTATVHVPADAAARVRAPGSARPVAAPELLPSEPGRVVYRVGSGRHRFVVREAR